MAETQNYSNHRRFFPLFHFFVLPVLGINLVWSIVRAVIHFGAWSLFQAVLAAAFVSLALSARIFALTVQDRVIRLEMRLRLERLLPADERARIADLSVAQVVSLRFAGDGELPELFRKVLAENQNDRNTIKKMVRNWQGDYLRA